jgi:hypothetical protein
VIAIDKVIGLGWLGKVLLPLMMISCSTKGVEIEVEEPVLIRDIIQRYNLDANDVLFIDEPPGKLKAIQIPVKGNKKESLTIWIRYDSSRHFSVDRDWEIEGLLNEQIDKVERK